MTTMMMMNGMGPGSRLDFFVLAQLTAMIFPTLISYYSGVHICGTLYRDAGNSTNNRRNDIITYNPPINFRAIFVG